MELKFWHDRWQANQIGFHQSEINTHLQQFWPRLGVKRGSNVFVPLCGKSRDLLWLRAQGYQVLGVEISAIAVRDFFAENQLIPTITESDRFERWEADGLVILCGDFFDLNGADLKRTLAVYDRASLIALPPAMRAAYVQHLSAILPPNCHWLLVTMEYQQYEMQGPPFCVYETEVLELFQNSFNVQRLFSANVLEEFQHFKAKGLSGLIEKIYHLNGLD